MKEDNRRIWNIFGAVLTSVTTALVLCCIGVYFFKSECGIFIIGALFGAVGGAITYHLDLVRTGRISNYKDEQK